jgi:hypothetical protein
MFERLVLEAFQSGLSWITILRRRDGFRAAFADFNPHVVAGFGPADRARLSALTSCGNDEKSILLSCGCMNSNPLQAAATRMYSWNRHGKEEFKCHQANKSRDFVFWACYVRNQGLRTRRQGECESAPLGDGDAV